MLKIMQKKRGRDNKRSNIHSRGLHTRVNPKRTPKKAERAMTSGVEFDGKDWCGSSAPWGW